VKLTAPVATAAATAAATATTKSRAPAASPASILALPCGWGGRAFSGVEPWTCGGRRLVRALPFLLPEFIEACGCREGGGWKVGLLRSWGHVAEQSQLFVCL